MTARPWSTAFRRDLEIADQVAPDRRDRRLTSKRIASQSAAGGSVDHAANQLPRSMMPFSRVNTDITSGQLESQSDASITTLIAGERRIRRP